MRLRLIRHATLLVRGAGHCLVVDPMLDPAGARAPVENTPNQRRNPLVELPEPPEVVVVNASGARFLDSGPLVMTTDDVVAVARHAPDAHVIAVHLEAINHCVETRADLHQRLHEEGLTKQVTVPEDGAEVPIG